MPKYKMTIKKVKYDDLSELIATLFHVLNILIGSLLYIPRYGCSYFIYV